MSKDKLTFTSDKLEKEFYLRDIQDMTVLGKNKLNFYINGETYQIKGDKTLNVLEDMKIETKLIDIRNLSDFDITTITDEDLNKHFNIQ